jgi:WD40 repeat protein
LEAWFEDLNAGSLTSLSFSEQPNPYPYGEAGAPGLKFWVPDFIVGTTDAFIVGVESSMFDEVRKEDRRGTLLMQGMTDEVIAVATHPSQTLVAIICGNGVLQLWNYEMKLLMVLRDFNGTDIEGTKTSKAQGHGRPCCVAFDATGGALGVGFASGVIKLLHTETLEDVANYTPSTDSIEKMKFSSSGLFFAAYDATNHVLIFKR